MTDKKSKPNRRTSLSEALMSVSALSSAISTLTTVTPFGEDNAPAERGLYISEVDSPRIVGAFHISRVAPFSVERSDSERTLVSEPESGVIELSGLKVDPDSTTYFEPSEDQFISAPSTPTKESDHISVKISTTSSKKTLGNSTSATGTTKRQCMGISKKTREQCKNPASSAGGDFCHIHSPDRKSASKGEVVILPKIFYSQKDGALVKVKEWTPGYLTPETVQRLMKKMQASFELDKEYEGLIYIYELRESNQGTVKFRVATTPPVKQGAEFPDGRYTLRKSYPGFVGPNKVVTHGKGVRSTLRLVTLIHIELEELVRNRYYLDDGWNHGDPSLALKAWPSSNGEPPSLAGARRRSCPDCKQPHSGVFEFVRSKDEAEGMEIRDYILPVLDRWGKFVEKHVGPAIEKP